MLKKKIRVFGDFYCFLKAVFSIKQSPIKLPVSSNNLVISLTRALDDGLNSLSKSIGLLPLKSLMFLSAPLINSYLIALVLLKSSLDFTDRCKGVRPLESVAFISEFHATM